LEINALRLASKALIEVRKEEQSEATKYEVVLAGSRTRGAYDVGRLRKEGGSDAAATPAATTCGSDRFDFRQSEQHSDWTVGLVDLADD